MEQLSLWATITEPTCLEPVLWNKTDYRNEKPEHWSEAQKGLEEILGVLDVLFHVFQIFNEFLL